MNKNEEMAEFLAKHNAMVQNKTTITNYDYPAEVEDIYKGAVIVKGLAPDSNGKLERDPKKAKDPRFAEIQSKFLSLKLTLPIGTKLTNGIIIQQGYQTPYGKAVYKTQIPDLYEELLSFSEDPDAYNTEINQFKGAALNYMINNVHIAKIRTEVPYFVMQDNAEGVLTKIKDRFGKDSTSNHFTVIAFDREDVQGMARKQLGILHHQKQFVSQPPTGEGTVAPETTKTIPETNNTQQNASTGT